MNRFQPSITLCYSLLDRVSALMHFDDYHTLKIMTELLITIDLRVPTSPLPCHNHFRTRFQVPCSRACRTTSWPFSQHATSLIGQSQSARDVPCCSTGCSQAWGLCEQYRYCGSPQGPEQSQRHSTLQGPHWSWLIIWDGILGLLHSGNP